jgi:hypothetical protein
MSNPNPSTINIEKTLIDDLRTLHGIDAIKEIKDAVLKEEGIEPIINITYNGDVDES